MSISIGRDRLTKLLRSAEGKRISVIGDAMLDVYLHGEVERVSPEAPVLVVRLHSRESVLGGAAYVAQNVVAMKAECRLIGVVGDDLYGKSLTELAGTTGAICSLVVDKKRPTTVKTRVISRAQHIVRLDEEVEHEIPPKIRKAVLVAAEAAIAESDGLILTDYNKGVLSRKVIRQCIAWARTRRIPIVVDPKHRNFHAYQGATILKPNRREFERSVHALDHRRLTISPRALRKLDTEFVLITLGEHGMALVSADGAVASVPAVAHDVEVYDVVGAGDTVTAYVAAMLAAGATAAEAAAVANYAAAVEVRKLGAKIVRPSDVLKEFDAANVAPSPSGDAKSGRKTARHFAAAPKRHP